jgi:hypothetical protein
MSLEIAPLTADGVRAARAALVALLQDAVDGGASVGFLPPLEDGVRAAAAVRLRS